MPRLRVPEIGTGVLKLRQASETFGIRVVESGLDGTWSIH